MSPKDNFTVGIGREPRDPYGRREQLLRLERGGSFARPAEVRSTAVIEPRVVAASCPHCGGTYRIHEHERAASSVRRVDAGCRNCGAPRTWWFRIVPAEPS